MPRIAVSTAPTTRIGPSATVEHIVAAFGQRNAVRIRIAIDPVVVITAKQDVIFIHTKNKVPAGSAMHVIRACTSSNEVIARAAVDEVALIVCQSVSWGVTVTNRHAVLKSIVISRNPVKACTLGVGEIVNQRDQ